MWRFITRNFAWKLGSLMLSVLLWFAIVGEPELVTTHSLPILYKNLPRGLLINSDAIDSVRVELRGPSGRLTEAALSDLAVTIDLSNVSSPGERTFTLSDADVRLPEGVTFVRGVPSQLRLRFSRVQSKDVPVEVKFASPPPEGYRIASQDVRPSSVRIAGPERRLAAIAVADTDAIDLSAVTLSSDIRVNTFVSDPQVWMESSPVVTVRVKLEKIGK
ncbi:MAG TPA: CdaR family protein [Bryobacteraceae bacterium]|nr:CdaR family protein [Bryobacteraceae bacterium]